MIPHTQGPCANYFSRLDISQPCVFLLHFEHFYNENPCWV
jgi:hypothetical protein